MSYLNVTDILKAGGNSLESKNYLSALAVALMLPSICSRISYVDENGQQYGKDAQYYKKWCNDYIKNDWIVSCLGKDYATILNALRCGFVHSGTIEANGKANICLKLGEYGTTEFKDSCVVCVKDLCNVIFASVQNWCNLRSRCTLDRVFVFKAGDYEDDSIYDELWDCDKTGRNQ